MIDNPMSILVLGASYGLGPGVRAAVAGHSVDFVCLPAEAGLIRSGQFTVRVAARNSSRMLDIGAADCVRVPDALAPSEVDTNRYELAILAMQEPQYIAPELRRLVRRLMVSGVPCVSIMNMPLPNYLENQLGTTITDELSVIWANTDLWMGFDPGLFTAASPDPQAIREPSDDALIIEVTLPSNLKVAPFQDPAAQQSLIRLTHDMDSVTIVRDDEQFIPRLRMTAHSSYYVPMAKWPMLMTGNFRCFRDGPPVSIASAVSENIDSSRSVYTWVTELCAHLIQKSGGLDDNPFVEFDRYCAAASSLSHPSSVARGIAKGATRVERVDKLIQLLGNATGRHHPVVDAIVEDVDLRLAANRSS